MKKHLNNFIAVISFSLIVSGAYSSSFKLYAQVSDESLNQSNTLTMDKNEYGNLDLMTKNFLDNIQEANTLYKSKSFSPNEEITLRVRLKDSFEEYFAVLVPTETKYSMETTEPSREAVQIAINEFILKNNDVNLQLGLTQDLDNYSKILTESLIHTTSGT